MDTSETTSDTADSTGTGKSARGGPSCEREEPVDKWAESNEVIAGMSGTGPSVGAAGNDTTRR